MYFIKESPFLNSQQVSMKTAMENQFFVLFFMLEMFLFSSSSVLVDNHISAVVDPGMKRDGLRVAFEAWHYCNEVGSEAPQMGSPSAADCFDLSNTSLVHEVTEAENRLGKSPAASNNLDLYAAENKQYLGSLCEAEDTPNPWHLLLDGDAEKWHLWYKVRFVPPKWKVWPFPPTGRFPCFGSGCMNQPLLYHQQTESMGGGKMKGGFNGTSKQVEPRVNLNLQYELSLGVLDYLCSRVLRGPAHLSAFVIYIALIHSFAKDYG